MSIHFFHKTLKQALKLTKSGKKNDLIQAKNILYDHTRDILADASEEQEAFIELLKLTKDYELGIQKVIKQIMNPSPLNRASVEGSINVCITIGKEIVKRAKKIGELSKDEELDAI